MSRSQHKIAKANNLSNLFFILCPKVNSPIAVPSFAYNHIPSCPIILTVCIQMQVRRLIPFSRISIPCQKSPLVRLAVRPQIDFFSPYLSTPHSNGTGCRLCCPVLPHCQGTFSKYFFDFLLYIIIQFIIPAAIPNLFYISPINIHTIQMMRIPIVA